MKIKSFVILCFVSFIIIAANNETLFNSINTFRMTQKDKDNYEKMWLTTDSLINRQLTSSALKQLDLLYQKAKKESNNAQIVKVLIYKSKLIDFKEEKSYIKIFEQFDNEIAQSQAPLKNLLHSLKAELLWRYYSVNRFKFIQRSHTVDFENNDIETWDLKTLVDVIIKEHFLALQNADTLKKINIETIEPILVKSPEHIFHHPTLYDFIAHRAVNFFSHEEPSITRPADYFKIDKAEYYNVLNDFVLLDIKNTDSMSLKYYAVKIYQDLLDFHIGHNNIKAIVDLEIQRLKFVNQNAEVEDKDSLLYNAYLNLEESLNSLLHMQNERSEAMADISFEIANLDYIRGLQYNPSVSDAYKWEIKKAYERAFSTHSLYPGSTGAQNCRHLMERITEKRITLNFETFIPSNTHFLSFINYSNIDKAYFRIIKSDYHEAQRLLKTTSNRETMIENFIKMKPVHTLSFDLIDDNDYQNNSTEIALPKLDKGHYLILASDNKNFSYLIGDVAYAYIHVTDIAYMSRRKNDGTYELFIVDRTNGAPISNAKAQTFVEEYNYRTRTYEAKKWKSFTSNNEGFISIPSDRRNDYRNFYIEISTKDDFIYSGRNFYQYAHHEPDRKARPVTTFFTDRAIYRPGQTVHFKGIVIEHKGEDKNIIPNYNTAVKFYDVNHQIVSELELKTNDFGTFSGSFIIPTGLMTGSMSIRSESGSKHFSVEEYKRPKYEVKFEPLKGVYRLNETIKVQGKAIAYAGNNIDGADVKYRIVRNTRFPYYMFGWRRSFPASPEVVIKNGTTTTDENGDFFIDFTAIPDNKVNKNFKPVFNYTVHVDVTDITGETRSGQHSISVGYTALLLNVAVQEEIDKESFKNFEISTTNLNGIKEPANCKVSIYKLKQPETAYRKRIWQAPSKPVLSEDKFRKLFPKDEYDNENDVSRWEKEDNVYTATVFTGDEDSFTPRNFNRWKSGKYVMEVKTTDAFNEEITQTYYFTLFNNKDKKTPTNDIHRVNFSKTNFEPGETLVFTLGTAENDVNVIYELEYGNDQVKREWLKLNNEQRRFQIPIKEEHRGNFSIHFAFVKDNRVYRTSQLITVPFSNRMLDIEFATFRDKLKPGQEEEWKIIIKDKKGDAMLAELLTSMYDASLDAFVQNHWFFNILDRFNYSNFYWDTPYAFGTLSATVFSLRQRMLHRSINKSSTNLNWFGFNFHHYYYDGYYYDSDILYETTTVSTTRDGRMRAQKMAAPLMAKDESAPMGGAMEEEDKAAERQESAGEKSVQSTETPVFDGGVQVRTNFNETAFFYPHLQTNEKGEVVVSFTVPESLTRWRIMNFAHTKDLKHGISVNELVTQKDLMVVANAPRFFRENDKITFTARVTNLSEKDLKGSAQLELFDALSMKSIDADLQNIKPRIDFEVKQGQSSLLTWHLHIKEGTQVVTYRIVAKAGNFSDGEEMAIPVLSNRMLVTESLPLPIRGKSSKTYEFEKLLKSAQSKTLIHHKLTLEFTSNPMWYAIQALPYLMEFPYECSEQIFSRYYANAIATHIANANPRIKRVFESWRTQSPEALLSNLEKNQELKSVLLEETPWVLNGRNESERKRRIALLFDLNKMANEKDRAVRQLLQHQSPNGGWPWFKGMPDDRYITQHIVTGIGKLKHLNIDNWENERRQNNAISKALDYLDERIREDYEYLKKHHQNSMHKDNISAIHIHYLYARSFYTNKQVNKNSKEAFDYYFGQAKKYWVNKNRYQQGMIALALNRYNETKEPQDIVAALRENALQSEEMGMYWKDNRGGYFWYQAPIETHALLIEVFDEVAKDKKAVEELKIWLLKQKQTQDWKTTKATAEAIYALILRGTDQLASDELVKITLGNMQVDPRQLDEVKVEAGTGYFKTSWSGKEIKPEMGKIKVDKVDDGIAWGAVYWQYFEQLDKITPHETPLKLTKKVFLEEQTASGKTIKPVSDNNVLKVGDKVIIRIELRVDRDMEYIHMKDMRASGFEPVNVFSHYKYQDGLGYYESTRDAATHFFFSYLRKGTYVFEYPLVVTHKGDFSNGITTIQCMYAPEFTSHSEGIRIRVE